MRQNCQQSGRIDAFPEMHETVCRASSLYNVSAINKDSWLLHLLIVMTARMGEQENNGVS